jgi:hypothetical protein
MPPRRRLSEDSDGLWADDGYVGHEQAYERRLSVLQHLLLHFRKPSFMLVWNESHKNVPVLNRHARAANKFLCPKSETRNPSTIFLIEQDVFQFFDRTKQSNCIRA